MTYFKQLLFILIVFNSLVAAAQSIPFTDERWTIDCQAHIKEYHKGQNSLYLQRGIAYLKDETFVDGIIEFDMYLNERVAFSGLIFRMEDDNNFEEIYLRGHHSGHPDAYQYTPVYNGLTGWQLYHDRYINFNDGLMSWMPSGDPVGYNGVVNFPFDRWTHIKIAIAGKKAEVYIDGEAVPSIAIQDLKRPIQAGGVGLISSAGAVHFANFAISSRETPRLLLAKEITLSKEPNAIEHYRVSTTFSESMLDNQYSLNSNFTKSLAWEKLTAEPNGLLNIARLRQFSREQNTALLEVKLESNTDQIKAMHFGYSERVKIWCNGQILYSGDNEFRSRDYRYLGTIGYFDTIYLPLKKGVNHIYFAVSENFGGWGLQAKLEDQTSIQLSIP